MGSTDIQVGIIACLDAVCQAFRDGGAIIEKVKYKRALKKAPPPPRLLEESIDAAPGEIEKEKQRGISRFGQAFEEGDYIAVIALQHIALQLQGSFLDKLKNAAFDDDHKTTDFAYLVDAADTARDRTIAALHDLKQRLLQTHKTPTVEVEPASADSSVSNLESLRRATITDPLRSSTEQSPPPPSQQEPTPNQTKHKTWSRDFSVPEEDSTHGAEDPRHAHQHRKRSSLLHFLKHHRSVSAEKYIPPVVAEEPTRNASVSTASLPVRPAAPSEKNELAQSPDSLSQTLSNFTYQDWEDNPAEIWGAKPSTDRRDTVAIAPDGVSIASTRSLPIDPLSRAATARSNSLAPNQSVAIPVPTPENDFLGFCKGAWKLQNGDRKGSMTKCREAEAWSRVPSQQSTKHYLACAQPKCAFRSHINHSNPDGVWDQVFCKNSLGIKFRWKFLAKSHVLQRVVVRGNYTFKCLFCVFLGGRGGVYQGLETLLEHIAQTHRGQAMGEVILYKAGCISDHIANQDEDYDINLWPLSAEEQQSRQKTPEWLSDDLMDPTRDANDSVFSAEPWNEGLSEFHYGGDFESTHLE